MSNVKTYEVRGTPRSGICICKVTQDGEECFSVILPPWVIGLLVFIVLALAGFGELGAVLIARLFGIPTDIVHPPTGP